MSLFGGDRVGELARRLPVRAAGAVEAARREAAERPIAYPVGSGEGEELALAQGLRPLIRQLLEAPALEQAQRWFGQRGLLTAVAPQVWGPTRDGWLKQVAPDAPGARRALYVGRDRARLEAAIACEEDNSPAAHQELGRLLGYPRCCVEAFVATPRLRRNPVLHAATLGRTRGRCHPRLNVLDLSVFHYVSWSPCAFDCELSVRYADAVAAKLAEAHPGFVAAIDQALGAGRLVLCDEAQLSVRFAAEGRAVRVEEAWPTARDRHPAAALGADALEAVARALALVRAAGRFEVTDAGLVLGGARVPGTGGALWVPFGAAAAS